MKQIYIWNPTTNWINFVNIEVYVIIIVLLALRTGAEVFPAKRP